MNILDLLRTYMIVRRSEWQDTLDSLEKANFALRLCQESFTNADAKYRAAMDTIADCRNLRVAAESAKFVAEQQAEQARARLKEERDQRLASEMALEKTQAALDASERGLAASQQALTERTAQLESAQASIVALTGNFERVISENKTLKETVSDLEATVNSLETKVADFALPDPPASAVENYPSSVIIGVTQKVIGVTPIIWDNTYRVVSEDDAVNFARARKARPWVAETWDCDNEATDFFSDCLKWGSNCQILTGDATGIGAHGWNAIVVRKANGDLDCIMFEPQTGERAQPATYRPTWGVADG